jgi:hypothetical protein
MGDFSVKDPDNVSTIMKRIFFTILTAGAIPALMLAVYIIGRLVGMLSLLGVDYFRGAVLAYILVSAALGALSGSVIAFFRPSLAVSLVISGMLALLTPHVGLIFSPVLPRDELFFSFGFLNRILAIGGSIYAGHLAYLLFGTIGGLAAWLISRNKAETEFADPPAPPEF